MDAMFSSPSEFVGRKLRSSRIFYLLLLFLAMRKLDSVSLWVSESSVDLSTDLVKSNEKG